MKSVVRPELPTAAAGSSQAPTAAVDNSAPLSTHPEPTYKSRKTVQLTGTTSDPVPPAYLRCLCSRLRFPQDPDYLFLAEPAALHLSVSFQ
jgi:hypothetical protein